MANRDTPRVAWFLCLLGAFFVPLGVIRVWELAAADALFIAAAGLLLLSPKSRRPSASLAFQIAAIVGAIAVLIASMTADDPVRSILAGIRLLYVWTVWQWGMRANVWNGQRLLGILTAFCLGAAASGLAGFMQVYLDLSAPGATMIWGRASGFQAHPNGQGGVLAAAAPMALMLILIPRRRLIGMWSLALVLVGLVLSGSVTGMIGAFAGILTALVLRRLSLTITVLVGLLTAGMAIFITQLNRLVPGAVSPLTRFADTTGQGSGVSTLETRLRTMQYAVDHIRESPFVGVGLDSGSGATYNDLTLTHNILLLNWFQGGLLLVSAVLVVLLSVLPRAVVIARRTDSPIVGGVVAGAMAALIVAMTGPVLYDRWFWFPVLLCACLTTDFIVADEPPRPASGHHDG